MASTNTEISWTDKTWNPVRGCTRVSDGCRHCYAERVAYRFSGPGKPYEGLAKKVGNEARWTGKVKLIEAALDEPISWRKPSRIFVNSMSDLFHEEVPFEFIDKVFTTMCYANQHTYQVLTKRPTRMLEYFNWAAKQLADFSDSAGPDYNWLKRQPHIWFGVSVENQEAADERVPLLLQLPANIRFLSCEPLLGPVTLKPEWIGDYTPAGPFSFAGRWGEQYLHWVIVGGESGPGARPMYPEWASRLRDQCQTAGVAFHFKQWGNWLPLASADEASQYPRAVMTEDHRLVNVGKKVAGRELDGREWNEFPEVKELTTAAQ